MEFLRDREAFSRLANKAGLITRDNWYEIDNRAETPEIFIYSEIGYIGATAEEFVAELRDITAPEMKVRINSMGGSIFEGVAIFNALRSHPARVITQVDSMAASIASVIAQAGDERIMTQRSQMLIHEAHGIAIGATASDMRELADILEQQTELIADIYAEAKGDKRSRSHFLALMRAKGSNLGTLLSDTETVKEGLADEVIIPQSRAAVVPEKVEPTSAPVDFSALFNTDPEDFEWSTPTEKELV